jgi:hypothetical protein
MNRLFGALLSLFLLGTCHAQENPRLGFTDHPVTQMHRGAIAAPVFRNDQDRLYRTRIREAANEGKVNFAGHYVLSAFGCGSSCLMVFALDADTGQVHWLPFTVSWGIDDKGIGADMLPLDFRPDSRLLIVAGSRNEHGHGLYHYVFEQGHFRLLHAHEDPPNGLWP